MTQALIYSIAPQHLMNILNGNKTIEVRKRDLPEWAKDKLSKGEDVWGYGYCTKGGKRLAYEQQPKHPYYILANSDGVHTANGRVVVKFRVSEVENISITKRKRRDVDDSITLADGTTHRMVVEYILEYKYDNPKNACITDDELHTYGNGNDLYAHHLSDITPVDMELGEFVIWDNDVWHAMTHWKKLTKAPQSFMTVWVK